jgi:hypothetical protein
MRLVLKSPPFQCNCTKRKKLRWPTRGGREPLGYETGMCPNRARAAAENR